MGGDEFARQVHFYWGFYVGVLGMRMSREELLDEMIELRDEYEELKREAYQNNEDALYDHARHRMNAVQECINIMVENDS